MKTYFTLFILLPIIAMSAKWESFSLRDNGTIPVWLVAGPFPNGNPGTHGEKCFGYFEDYLAPIGGEKKATPAEGDMIQRENGEIIKWKTAFSSVQGLLDYIDITGVNKKTPGVAYAFCYLEADKRKEVLFKIRSNDGVRVWLNQHMIHDHHVGRTIEAGEDRVQVTLEKGKNPLLLKVDQGGGAWGLALAIVDLTGQSVEGITASIAVQELLHGKIQTVKIHPTPLIIKTPDGERQIIEGEILSGGLDDLTCRISKDEWDNPYEIHFEKITPGNTSFQVEVPVIQETGPAHVILQTDTKRLDFPNITLHKARKWVLYLVQHVHTDIGYTRPQTEILPEHLRFIDFALDYCDLTDDYPDDAKFRWTCEVSWPVREYLKRRPKAQIDKLKQRIAEGRIEVNAMFLNMSEIATEDALAASLQPIHEFKQLEIPVQTAMQNDVNGIGWCLVDYFSDIGVKYLMMGINETRSVLPFDRPTAFWWESPSGKRLLAFRADHYHEANYWQLHNADMEFFQPRLVEYLERLIEINYPFDRISVQYSGYHTDNSPPSSKACDLVKVWNESYLWPKLRIATAHEYMQYVEQQYDEQLPVYRVAWPDWWTDGFGSAARETAEARRIHNATQSDQGLLAMASLLGANVSQETHQRISKVQDELLFYDEHTFGSAESISDPLSENSLVQWGEKSSYIWQAVKKEGMLREEAIGLLQPMLPRNKFPTLIVFNTLSWKRSGLVEVFIDHEILPQDVQYQIIDNESGMEMSARALRSRSEGTYWAIWAQDVPPMGYKAYRIVVGAKSLSQVIPNNPDVAFLENSFYKLQLDPLTGALKSLYDKELEQELIDTDCSWKFGQFVYEISHDGRDFNRQKFERTSLKNIKIKAKEESPVWQSLIITADADGCKNPDGINIEIRLYELEKRIEFHYRIRKQRVADAEACYAVFPFKLKNADISYEAQGGFVTPGKTQLPGSSSDWHTVQNFISIRNEDVQIIFGSREVPLVQFGEINLGKWQYVSEIKKPHIYSWVMNNYWFTNFRAFQEGEFEWSYFITSTKDNSNRKSTQFSRNTCRPLIPRILPAGTTNDGKSYLSSLDLGASNVLMVNVKPSAHDNSIILHLREIEGNSALVSFEQDIALKKYQSVDVVNVLEESLTDEVSEVSFNPFEVKFVRLNLNKL